MRHRPAVASGNVAQARGQLLRSVPKAIYTIGEIGLSAGTFFYSPNYPEHRRRRRIPVGHLEVHCAEPMALTGRRRHGTCRASSAVSGSAPATPSTARANSGASAIRPESGVNYADYNTWNVGLGFTWKVFTLDLRYSDTDLSRAIATPSPATTPRLGRQRHLDQPDRPRLEVVRRDLIAKSRPTSRSRPT